MMLAFFTASVNVDTPSYMFYRDNGLVMVLLGCFFIMSFVLSRSRKLLFQLMSGFLMNRKRTSIFTTSTVSEVNYLLLLVLVSCVLMGTCIYCLCVQQVPMLIAHVDPSLLLGIYIGGTIVYLLLKWLSYLFIGWIFFGKEQTMFWIESYLVLIYYSCFYLFPLSLILVFVSPSFPVGFTLFILLLVMIRLCIFYKWIQLFSVNLYGLFHFFLYFCALEITPCILLGASTLVINNLLTI